MTLRLSREEWNLLQDWADGSHKSESPGDSDMLIHLPDSPVRALHDPLGMVGDFHRFTRTTIQCGGGWSFNVVQDTETSEPMVFGRPTRQ